MDKKTKKIYNKNNISALARYLGVSTATIFNWRNGKYKDIQGHQGTINKYVLIMNGWAIKCDAIHNDTKIKNIDFGEVSDMRDFAVLLGANNEDALISVLDIANFLNGSKINSAQNELILLGWDAYKNEKTK
jgi:hypothetical protein